MREKLTDNPNFTGRARLSIEQVILCLTELKGVSGRELARRWGVSHSTVNNIRAGNNWKSHIALLGLPAYQKRRPVKEKNSLQNI